LQSKYVKICPPLSDNCGGHTARTLNGPARPIWAKPNRSSARFVENLQVSWSAMVSTGRPALGFIFVCAVSLAPRLPIG
jgi:hypothetical protein